MAGKWGQGRVFIGEMSTLDQLKLSDNFYFRWGGGGVLCIPVLYSIINIREGSVRNSAAIFQVLLTTFKYSLFQSCIDAAASVVLLSSTLTIKDPYQVRNTGFLGSLECRLWNTQFLMWSLFIASTYHMIIMTVERYKYSRLK